MASRFYLPNVGSAPPVSPATSAGWESVGGAQLREILQRDTPSNTALANRTQAAIGTNPSDMLLKQYVSPALAAQTISAAATVKGQILCSEASGAVQAAANMRLYVYRPDNSSIVGVLIEMLSGGSTSTPPEFQLTTATNRKFPRSWAGAGQVVAGQVVTQANDVLVCELGYGETSTSTLTSTLRLGDPTAGTDLPEDETTTTDLRPWIEISQTIIYAADVQVVAAVQVYLSSG